jgi:hypothetical protein
MRRSESIWIRIDLLEGYSILNIACKKNQSILTTAILISQILNQGFKDLSCGPRGRFNILAGVGI